MSAITIIKNEHQNLAAVLFSLEHLLAEIDSGKQANFAVFHGLFTYIDRFLDRYHHPKENEFLFPALLARAPDCAPLLQQLGEQHRDGARMFVDMLKALSAYEFCGASEYSNFKDRVLAYCHFEREHAALEEREVLPRAIEVFPDSDWAGIDTAFGENQDPMFGDRWNDEFSVLFSKLVNSLPSPLGLGEAWK